MSLIIFLFSFLSQNKAFVLISMCELPSSWKKYRKIYYLPCEETALFRLMNESFGPELASASAIRKEFTFRSLCRFAKIPSSFSHWLYARARIFNIKFQKYIALSTRALEVECNAASKSFINKKSPTIPANHVWLLSLIISFILNNNDINFVIMLPFKKFL